MSKIIYCIRHGISQHNINYLHHGSKTFYDPAFTDTSLIKEGFQQARHLKQTWTDIDSIELVVVSPLKRTLQTAWEIFGDREVPIISLESAREFPMGLQTCNKRSNTTLLQQKYPTIDFSDLQTNEDSLWLTHREETIDELNLRIQKITEFLLCRPETHIAFVNHSSFIGQMKDNHIRLLDNGDEELKHCYPYKIQLTTQENSNL